MGLLVYDEYQAEMDGLGDPLPVAHEEYQRADWILHQHSRGQFQPLVGLTWASCGENTSVEVLSGAEINFSYCSLESLRVPTIIAIGVMAMPGHIMVSSIETHTDLVQIEIGERS